MAASGAAYDAQKSSLGFPSLPPILSSTKTMHSGPTTWQTPPVLGQNPTVTEEKEHTAQRLPPPELSLGWPSPPSVAVTTAPL